MALMTNNPRAIFAAAAIAAVLFLLAVLRQNPEHGEKVTGVLSNAAGKAWSSSSGERTFFEIAKDKGTDKVTTHNYQNMYDTYLPSIRNKKIKMLEIGLGCDMGYGPGASYYTWLEYFPNVDLYYLEFDAKCAEKWAHKTTGATVTTGDQGDPAVLEAFISKYGGDFDVIVDDGGHTMDQQMTSLQHLWKAIKPGGMYFCEDLQTSFDRRWGGGDRGMAGTMTDYIHKVIEDMMIPEMPRQVVFEDVEEIMHVDCYMEICGFFKDI